MSNDSNQTQLCPTCGSKLKKNATRCLVCGNPVSGAPVESEETKLQGPKIPEVRLSLPIAMAIILVVLAIGAAIVYFLMQPEEPILNEEGQVITETPAPSTSATVTITPTVTQTSTEIPTPTKLPPLEYQVKEGDLCSSLAAAFDVSVNSIIIENNLDADCSIYPGNVLLIPQPTPTASPQPTNTLSIAEVTEQACDKLEYKVTDLDTLSSISLNYNVSMDTIKEVNGLPSDIIYEGMTLTIPLCMRNPTQGATPTPTAPPPYIASNLLQPSDGEVFLSANDTITLQWASVGTLRDNEAYAVTIEDLTAGTGEKFIDYVTDTKYIVTSQLRPTDDQPHIFRWWITPVRQTGSTNDGQPIWASAGEKSVERVFSWWGTGQATPNP